MIGDLGICLYFSGTAPIELCHCAPPVGTVHGGASEGDLISLREAAAVNVPRRLRRAGHSIRSVAKMLDVSVATAHAAVREVDQTESRRSA